MYYYNHSSQKASDWIRFSCAFLFCAFTFSYLYFMLGDVLAQAQHAFSHGATTYSQFMGATIITIILILLQALVARLTNLSSRWYALSYFPSFLTLSVIASINKNAIEDFTFGAWLWLFPLLLIVYGFVIRIVKRIGNRGYDDDDFGSGKSKWTNYLILLIMILLTGNLQKATDVDMYEMKVEQEIIDEDNEEAAQVGILSLASSPRLNNLRAFALAQMGQLGEHLFDYPQEFGNKGLLDLSDTLRSERINSMTICGALDFSISSVNKTLNNYLNEVLVNDSDRTSPLVRDYCLANALLNKDINSFSKIFSEYYKTDSITIAELPKAYKEALLIESSQISFDSLNNFSDTITLKTYNDYQKLCEEYTDNTERYNYTRRQFGTTFIWYFFNR